MKLVALFALLAAACSSDPEEPAEMMIAGACNGIVRTEHATSAQHVDMGSTIEWTNNPPTGGDHYPLWAAWDLSYSELPRGNYVHNLEHGGIVLLYHCDPACPDVVDQLLEVARNMDTDPACDAPITKRVIVTGDPLLPAGVQVAAVAWNHAYTASCFDGYVAKFAAQYYGQGTEATCANGANLGGTPIEP
jgi:hypothetical protein